MRGGCRAQILIVADHKSLVARDPDVELKSPVAGSQCSLERGDGIRRKDAVVVVRWLIAQASMCNRNHSHAVGCHMRTVKPKLDLFYRVPVGGDSGHDSVLADAGELDLPLYVLIVAILPGVGIPRMNQTGGDVVMWQKRALDAAVVLPVSHKLGFVEIDDVAKERRADGL